jgi:hypothetical protein
MLIDEFFGFAECLDQRETKDVAISSCGSDTEETLRAISKKLFLVVVPSDCAGVSSTHG